jgi:hypothetical protein
MNVELLSIWFSRREAADYLSMSLSSLAHMACEGTGPRFFKAGGKVRYLKEDLDCWAMGEEFTPIPMKLQNFTRQRSRHKANVFVEEQKICDQIVKEALSEVGK